MTTLHVQVDDATVEVIRQQAKQAGKTPEVLASETLFQQFGPGSKEWIKDFLAATEHPKGNSGGWKFNREELYDR